MKLLHRTVRSYLIYSLLVLVVAIPLFYFIIQALCLQDVDEVLRHHKNHLALQLNSRPEILDHLPWHDVNNTLAIFPPVQKASAEKNFTLQRYSTLSGEDEPFRELHSFITVHHKTYPVVLRISLIDIEDLIQGIVIAVILVMVLILAGLLWINRRQSRRLWQPFYQALGQLQHFNLNKKNVLHFSSTSISEFKDLQLSIEQLTGRIYKTYLQQKEFTENAAHEMQTPLAAMQAKLEMLMQEEDLTKEQARHIQAINEAIYRMIRLNKGLLLLAKIENNQFAETEEIQLVPMVRRILDSLNNQIVIKHLHLSESYQEIAVSINSILADILLSNLITNALRHTLSGGCIEVKTYASHISISNTGDPLPFPEEKLFQRFQKGTHPEASGGNGLGLAIVKQICSSCHFTIDHHYQDNMHCFTVTFPV